MIHLYLTLPGFSQRIDSKYISDNFNTNLITFGGLVAGLLDIFFSLALFMGFFYLVWGSFQYILASGKKEELAKARSRITWTLIGLVVIFSAFFIAKFAQGIFLKDSILKGGTLF